MANDSGGMETMVELLDLKMTSAQVVETSVANNNPSQDSSHPDDHFQSRYVTPGFKLFSCKEISSAINQGLNNLLSHTTSSLQQPLPFKIHPGFFLELTCFKNCKLLCRPCFSAC